MSEIIPPPAEVDPVFRGTANLKCEVDTTKADYGTIQFLESVYLGVTWSEIIEFERRFSRWAVENELKVEMLQGPEMRAFVWIKASKGGSR